MAKSKFVMANGLSGDLWVKKCELVPDGKIPLSGEMSQNHLEYLHSINFDGVVKVDEPLKEKKK
jgi:hypothetical protein